MAEIDLAAVMTAISDAADPLVDLKRRYDYPTRTVNPPCLVVGYPEGTQAFDATMRRGFDRALFPVWYVVGDFVARTSRDTLSAAILPLKAAFEPNLGGAVSTARVQSWSIEPFAVEGLTYVSVKFEIDVLA